MFGKWALFQQAISLMIPSPTTSTILSPTKSVNDTIPNKKHQCHYPQQETSMPLSPTNTRHTQQATNSADSLLVILILVLVPLHVQIQMLASDLLVHIQHVLRDRLEVTTRLSSPPRLPGGIVARRHENVALLRSRPRTIRGHHRVEAVDDLSQQVNSRLQLLLRLLRLHRGRHDGNVDTLRTDLVFVAHAGHVDVRVALLVSRQLHLLGRNDDLAALGAVDSLDGVVEQTDGPHHLSRLAHLLLLEVRGVADDHLRTRSLALRDHADHLLVLELDAVDLTTSSVRHSSTGSE